MATVFEVNIDDRDTQATFRRLVSSLPVAERKILNLTGAVALKILRDTIPYDIGDLARSTGFAVDLLQHTLVLYSGSGAAGAYAYLQETREDYHHAPGKRAHAVELALIEAVMGHMDAIVTSLRRDWLGQV